MDDLVEMVADFGRGLWAHPLLKAIGGVLVFLATEAFGGIPSRPLVMLAVLVALDTVAGFSYAVATKAVESPRLLRGLVKLALYFGTLLVLNLMARAGLDSTWEGIMRGIIVFAIGYLLTTEGISLLEHIARWAAYTGLSLPVLDSVLGVLRTRKETLERKAQDLAKP